MKKLFIFIYIISISSVNYLTSNTISDSNSTKLDETSSLGITIASQYPDYLATPGDVYYIRFRTAGNIVTTEMTGFVDSNYNIDLSFIGIVNVRDLIYTDVQKTIKSQITKSYPDSIVNVMLNAPGQFKFSLLVELI